MTFEQIERVMDVDFWGVVNGTKAFLPHLIASGDGHIVNISSLFGLMAVPSQGAYNAAKFAVRGFTEALRQEMKLAGHPVEVTCVHPGGIKTAIARNAGAVDGADAAALAAIFDKRLAKTSADAAAQDHPAGGPRATRLASWWGPTPRFWTCSCGCSARGTNDSWRSAPSKSGAIPDGSTESGTEPARRVSV